MDNVNNRADKEEIHGKKGNNAAADAANIEIVRTEAAQEQAQEKSHPFLFIAGNSNLVCHNDRHPDYFNILYKQALPVRYGKILPK